MDRHARTRWLTAFLLLLVFGTGFVLGMAVGPRGEEPAAVQAVEGEEDEAPQERRTPMYEQVGPTADQKVLIDSIVSVHREKMRALQEEFRAAYTPRYEALIDSTRNAIKEVFTPEQTARYDSLLQEFDARRAEERARERREREEKGEGGR
ncbi:MAG: hypothetical protein ACE5GJ_00150 [Gemmatimonadota bacterium]